MKHNNNFCRVVFLLRLTFCFNISTFYTTYDYCIKMRLYTKYFYVLIFFLLNIFRLKKHGGRPYCCILKLKKFAFILPMHRNFNFLIVATRILFWYCRKMLKNQEIGLLVLTQSNKSFIQTQTDKNHNQVLLHFFRKAIFFSLLLIDDKNSCASFCLFLVTRRHEVRSNIFFQSKLN